MPIRRTRIRRLVAVVASLAASAGVLIAVQGLSLGAAAAPADTQLVSANPVNWTPKVLDGRVLAVKRIGNVVVVGGSFTQIQDVTAGAPIINRPYLFAFDATTGLILPNWNPAPDAQVDALVAAPGNNAVYVAGQFSTIAGVGGRVAMLNLADGTRVSSFRAPGINNEVYDMRLVGSRLFIAGSFYTVAQTADPGLSVLDATTGARVTGYDVPDVAGVAWDPTSTTTVRKIDVTPAGDRLVAIGNFSTVGGLARTQIAMLNLGSSSATVADWTTSRFQGQSSPGAAFCSRSFDSYMRDVSISPDGSFFVVVTTGAYKANWLCDSASRWETYGSGAQTETWSDLTGGDTFWGVLVTGPVVYIGGHMRWLNNPYLRDAAGPGAVPRQGIGAIDARNGLPLSWNPGRKRGVGLFDFDMTSTELWAGSDTSTWAGETRPRLAAFPFSGGSVLPSDRTATLPADVVLLDSPAAGVSQETRNFDGSTVVSSGTAPNADDWSQARGAVMIDGTVYTGWADGTFRSRAYDGSSFGPATSLSLYNNGYSTNTSAYTLFSTEIPRITGMFYDRATSRLYYTLRPDAQNKSGGFFYRYFTPESGVIGAQRFTAANGSLIGAGASGTTTPQSMFLAGGKVYYSDSAGALRRIDFAPGVAGAAGGVTGSSTLVDGSRDWRSNAAFASTAASNIGPNVKPTAAVSASCQGLTCSFDASASNDPDGSIVTYSFAFGDGSSSGNQASSTAQRTYGTAGQYTVTVTVTDNRGGVGTASTTVNPQQVSSSIAFRVAKDATFGSTTSQSFTLPAAVATGDRLVMAVTGSTTATLTTPSGWAVANSQTDVDTATYLLTRVATAADAGATVVLQWSAATRPIVSVAAYSGVGGLAVTGAVETSGSSVAAHTTPGVSVPANGSWVVSYWSDKNASSTTWTAPAGQTVRALPAVTVAAGTTRVSGLLTDDGSPVSAGPRPGLTAVADGTATKATMFTVVLAPA